MRCKMGNGGPRLSENDLDSFEKDANIVLPAEYRSFLLRHNGGLPSPDVIDVKGAPGSPTDVQVFFGIGRPVESSDLRWNRRTFVERLPNKWLPIAHDSGGNLFCLSLSGPDVGSVMYVDLDQALPGFYSVARNIDEFLDQLRTSAA